MSDKSHHFIRYEILDEKMIVEAIRDDDSLIERLEISKKRVVCPDCGAAEMVGSVKSSDLDEISGIAASRKSPGIFWVHNDYPGAHPEDANKIYAMTLDGTIIATCTISSLPGARDPEDIAVGPGPLNGTGSPAAGHYIYWGDIGDNSSQYSEIWIKRIPEPSVDMDQAPADITLGPEDGVEVIRLKYPSGVDAPSNKDSETLMVDPLTGDIYVVTKRMWPNRVYKASYPQSTMDVGTMEYVATLPETPGLAWITGGDISADGSLIILRKEGVTDYVNIWYRETGEEIGDRLRQDPCLYEIHAEPQGEAVGFDPQGESFYTVSEAHSSSEPIWHYPIIWGFSSLSMIYVNKDDDTCGGNSPCFTSIQDGINAAANTGAAIKIAQGTYNESIVLNETKPLILQGGWNPSFTNQTSNTTVIKTPEATQGSLTLQMVTIRP